MFDFLHEGYFVLFLIITLGIMLGEVKIKGFSLDLSAVIFVALFMGHLGFTIPAEFQTIGLLFFIFTIGIQAGPGFFDAFMKFGRQLIVLCLMLISIAGVMAYAAASIFDIQAPVAIGIFNGALTSTPGLAAAIDATKTPVTAVGYGIAYPAGVVGVILFMHIFPRLLRISFKEEEDKYHSILLEEHPSIHNRILKISNQNIDGKSLRELNIRIMTGGIISRVKHGDTIFAPKPETRLYTGDIINAVGSHDALTRMELLIGEPVEEDLSFDERYVVNWALVTNKQVVNKSIREINLTAMNANITRIRRSGIDLTPNPHSRLRFGDKLMIAGSRQEMPEVMKMLGNDEKRLSETNFLPISFGIVIGVAMGAITIPFFGLFDFRLGLTGGVLAVALVLSRIGKTGPVIWSMSGSANQLMRKLGLLMFMATVGINAGGELAEILKTNGLQLIAIGASITFVPMTISGIVGHYFFRMNSLTLLGVIAGSMTSTPGLAALDGKTECEAPSVGYATVYPPALVLMIIFSQVLAILL
jgi:putative transport protein